jgi:protein FRG1
MKTSALRFKGESGPVAAKKQKKSKRKAREDEGSGDVVSKKASKMTKGDTSSSASESVWTRVDKVTEARGPLLLVTSAVSADSLTFISSDTQFQMFLSAASTQKLDEIEPNQVNQVFIAKEFPGSSGGNKISLKSCFDRHLGTNQYGVLDCDKEALSSLHEWELIPREDGFALHSPTFGTFISVDGSSGSIKETKLRCDSKTIGTKEIFTLFCQKSAKEASKASSKSKDKVTKDLAFLEAEKIKQFHGHPLGKVRLGASIGEDLGDAAKEGKLNEAMLDKRSKMKRDKVGASFLIENINTQLIHFTRIVLLVLRRIKECMYE